jgi:hypothetical protein
MRSVRSDDLPSCGPSLSKWIGLTCISSLFSHRGNIWRCTKCRPCKRKQKVGPSLCKSYIQQYFLFFEFCVLRHKIQIIGQVKYSLWYSAHTMQVSWWDNHFHYHKPQECGNKEVVFRRISSFSQSASAWLQIIGAYTFCICSVILKCRAGDGSLFLWLSELCPIITCKCVYFKKIQKEKDIYKKCKPQAALHSTVHIHLIYRIIKIPS